MLKKIAGQPKVILYPAVGEQNFRLSRYIDKTTPLGDVLGADSNTLEMAILAAADDDERIEVAEAFLRSHLPDRPN